jgi:uncharacterized membrane protein
MCLASVVYHQEYLKSKLHSKNKFRLHPFMAHLPEVHFLHVFLLFKIITNIFLFFLLFLKTLSSESCCPMLYTLS